jgi:hypothetical protein
VEARVFNDENVDPEVDIDGNISSLINAFVMPVPI